MAGRRGGLRGGRSSFNQVDSFVLGRGEGVVQSRSREFSESEEQLGLGFQGRAGGLRESDRRQEVPCLEESSSPGGAFNRGGRAFSRGGGTFSCGGQAGLSSRGGRSRAAPGLVRRGGRSRAANVGAGDSPAAPHSRTGRGGAASRSTSQQVSTNSKP